MLLLAERFHAPGRLETAQHEVHRYEHPHLEALDELPCTQCVAVANAPIHGKHHQVKPLGNLLYVFQFAQETLFLSHWVDVLTQLLAVGLPVFVAVRKEPRIPVAQVSCVEDALSLGFHYPAHSAVVAPCGGHLYILVGPCTAFGQPYIGLSLIGPAVLEDIF